MHENTMQQKNDLKRKRSYLLSGLKHEKIAPTLNQTNVISNKLKSGPLKTGASSLKSLRENIWKDELNGLNQKDMDTNSPNFTPFTQPTSVFNEFLRISTPIIQSPAVTISILFQEISKVATKSNIDRKRLQFIKEDSTL